MKHYYNPLIDLNIFLSLKSFFKEQETVNYVYVTKLASYLFNICAAWIACSFSGVSTKSGIAAEGGWRGMQGPFKASIRETAS